MEIIGVPLTAATKKLHLGNLYNWILIDSYRRACNLQGRQTLVRESWNCYSEKLENQVLTNSYGKDSKNIEEKCKEIIEENVLSGREILKYYSLDFSLPPLRDDSEEYKEFVIKKFERYKSIGKITDTSLKIVEPLELIKKCKNISWKPEEIWKRFNGLSSLQGIQETSLFRNGIYGIRVPSYENLVLGQRFVQSLIPDFYKESGIPINIGIFGNDILAKSIYFMITNCESVPFERLGLSGMVLDDNKKKISKYSPHLSTIKDISEHPDNVRLSLLKQTFGKDFVIPKFQEQERFRRKIENCFNFLLKHTSIKRDGLNLNEILKKTEFFSNEIIERAIDLDFSGAYKKFYDLIYNFISQEVIETIKNKELNSQDLTCLNQRLMEVSKIFVPKTIETYLVKMD